MSPFYTRNGDDGTTGMLGEERISKQHPRMEALGAVDEASAALGMARALAQESSTGSIIVTVQRDLYQLMSELAATPQNAPRFQVLNQSRLEWMESTIDKLTTTVPLPTGFILPGDSQAGAALAVARTVVRRAERRVVGLLEGGEIENLLLPQYLNRLSSLCFALELCENQAAGQKNQLVKDDPTSQKENPNS
jgi:cob(I)alamin adenosyltransferase